MPNHSKVNFSLYLYFKYGKYIAFRRLDDLTCFKFKPINPALQVTQSNLVSFSNSMSITLEADVKSSHENMPTGN